MVDVVIQHILKDRQGLGPVMGVAVGVLVTVLVGVGMGMGIRAAVGMLVVVVKMLHNLPPIKLTQF